MADLFYDPLGFKIIREEPVIDNEEDEAADESLVARKGSSKAGKGAQSLNLFTRGPSSVREVSEINETTTHRVTTESQQVSSGRRHRWFYFLLFPVIVATLLILWFFWPRHSEGMYGEETPVRDLPGGSAHVFYVGGPMLVAVVLVFCAVAYQRQYEETVRRYQMTATALSGLVVLAAMGWIVAYSRDAGGGGGPSSFSYYSNATDMMALFRKLGLWLLCLMTCLAVILFCFWGRFHHSGSIRAVHPQGSEPGQRQSIGREHFRRTN